MHTKYEHYRQRAELEPAALYKHYGILIQKHAIRPMGKAVRVATATRDYMREEIGIEGGKGLGNVNTTVAE